MDYKSCFYPQVLDEGGRLRRRFDDLHRRTRVQKMRLAAEALDAGLTELEKRISDDAPFIPAPSPVVEEKKEEAKEESGE